MKRESLAYLPTRLAGSSLTLPTGRGLLVWFSSQGMRRSIQLCAAFVALLLGAERACAQDGSRTWTGVVSSDFYDGDNWNPTGNFPNANATFSGTVSNSTIERTSGTYSYVFGLKFANTLGTQSSFTFASGGTPFRWGGPTFDTSTVTSGSLLDEIGVDLVLGGNVAAGQNLKVLTIGERHDLHIRGNISGGGAGFTFTKAGDGALILSGTNSCVASVMVTAGTLQVGDGGSSGSLNPANPIEIRSGTFAINQGDTVTQGADFSGAPITGSGTFAVKGGATVVLTQAVTFADTLFVSVASNSFLGLDFVGTNLVAGLDLGGGPVAAGVYGSAGSGAANETDRLLGTGRLFILESVTWDGTDDMTWAHPDSTSWSGTTYDDGDNVIFGDTGAGTVMISGAVAPGSITVNSAEDYTFSGGAISGSGTLNKSGLGRLTVSTANRFSGGTTVNDGTIQVDHGDALGTGSITVGSPATAKLEFADGVTVNEVIMINGSAFGGSAWKLSSRGSSTLTGPVTVNGSSRVNAGGTINFDGGLISSNSTQLFAGDANFIVNPLLLGTGDLWQHGSCMFFGVTGNTWSTHIIAFGGSTYIRTDQALPMGSGIQFGWGNNVNWNVAVLHLADFDQEVAFIETVAEGLGLENNQIITGGSGTLTVNQTAASKAYQGRITGGISLVKTGTGRLILDNRSGIASDYRGTFEIVEGVVESQSGSDFSDVGSLKISSTTPGALSLNYVGTDTIGALDLGAGNLPDGVYGAGDAADSNGVLTGTGTLTVAAPPPPQAMIEFPVRFHLISDITMEKKGVEMGMWVSAEDVVTTLLPEINSIWEPAGIRWVLESLLVENSVDLTNKQEVITIIQESDRSTSTKMEEIISLFPEETWHPAIHNIYLFPFIGGTRQGNARSTGGWDSGISDDGGNRSTVGVWTDKPSFGASPPEKFPLMECLPFQIGSIARTCSHELGHNLGLSHPNSDTQTVFNRLMGGLMHGYVLLDEEINRARDVAARRLETIALWNQLSAPGTLQLSLDVALGEFRVGFSSLEQARYDVEVSNSLESDEWTVLMENHDINGTTGSLETFISGIPFQEEEGMRFFRVQRSGP